MQLGERTPVAGGKPLPPPTWGKPPHCGPAATITQCPDVANGTTGGARARSSLARNRIPEAPLS